MARKTNGSIAANRKKNTVVPTVSHNVSATVQESRLEDDIRRRAYEIYLERNGSPGDEYEDWLSAEREILARH